MFFQKFSAVPSVGGFALYRLPYADHYVEIRQTEGEVEELRSPVELSGKSGFVLAPFAVTDDCPLLIIREDIKVRKDFISHKEDQQGIDSLNSTTPITHLSSTKTHSRQSYSIDFVNYHSKLLAGEFQKIVLARTAIDETTNAVAPRSLFERACELYPRMFVSLVSTPRSGTWLTATPEILLEGHSHEWQTMALAGTMKLSGEQLAFDNPPRHERCNNDIVWSEKNKEEQRLVATYIEEQLKGFSNSVTEDGPYTVRAGNLVHLRSDFRFTLKDQSQIGTLIAALHPTPAVSGLPKDETYRFILENEAKPRRYYSGFMGLLASDGDTHLYVSLRCMELLGRQYRLYAGGGLLTDSTEESEWNETEAKMETMRQCLQTRKTSTF